MNTSGRIIIDSILGGHNQLSNFATKDSFFSSLGIDPSQPAKDTTDLTSVKGAGLLRPNGITKLSGSVISNPPMWITDNPKDSVVYVYDANGSTYSMSGASPVTTTALSDGGTMTGGAGNGAAYYDNYIYFAKGTDIARYGPLNGVAEFVSDFWTGAAAGGYLRLGKTALTNTTYPTNKSFTNYRMPNHIMHRHSDGILYIADIVNNQGVLHTIQTTRTAVEGDTDNGSTYQKLTFGYGLYPTAIESYGNYLVIALMEESSFGSKRGQRAKLAFWDTISQNFNSIIWVEFPDTKITALKNANGILYIFSGNHQSRGFRLSKYVGGSSIQDIYFFDNGESPFPGAVDAVGDQLLFGTYCTQPASRSALFSYGLQKLIKNRLFCIATSTLNSSGVFTAVKACNVVDSSFGYHYLGFTTGSSGTSNNGVDSTGYVGYSPTYYWWSQIYKIGQPFQIKRIRIPLFTPMAANITITPTIYFDNYANNSSQVLTTINNTNFSNGSVVANIYTAGDGSNIMMGQNNFWLELKWTGSALGVVSLPIIIDYELIPD